MRSIGIPALLLLLLVAACGPAEVTNQQGPTTMAVPTRYTEVQQRVVDLPQRQRFGVFLRAIRDGNAPCQGVVEEIRQADQNGRPVFTVRCKDDPLYAIAIDSKGVAEVARLNQGG